jgi:hypothetical protein
MYYLKSVTCTSNSDILRINLMLFMIKFRHYENAKKCEKISHLFWSCFYSVASKQVGDFFKNFVTFSEKLDFNICIWRLWKMMIPTGLIWRTTVLLLSNWTLLKFRCAHELVRLPCSYAPVCFNKKCKFRPWVNDALANYGKKISTLQKLKTNWSSQSAKTTRKKPKKSSTLCRLKDVFSEHSFFTAKILSVGNLYWVEISLFVGKIVLTLDLIG